MDTSFIFLVLSQSVIIVIHAWRRITNMFIFIKYKHMEPSKAVLGNAYNEVLALIEFTKLTFAHSSFGSIIAILIAAGLNWHLVAGYFAFYALVILPVVRYQLIKHRGDALFRLVKPIIKF